MLGIVLVKVKVTVMSDSLQPHGPYCPWNTPDQNIGVGSYSLLQGIFLAQGLNLGLLHCRQILYCLSHQGSQFQFSSVRNLDSFPVYQFLVRINIHSNMNIICLKGLFVLANQGFSNAIFSCIWQGVSSTTSDSRSVLDQVVWVFLNEEGELGPTFSWDVKPWNGWPVAWLDWEEEGQTGNCWLGKAPSKAWDVLKTKTLPRWTSVRCSFWRQVFQHGHSKPKPWSWHPWFGSSSWMEGLDFSCAFFFKSFKNWWIIL